MSKSAPSRTALRVQFLSLFESLALLLVVITVSDARAAEPQGVKFGGYCAYGLSVGKQVPTDCRVTWQSPSKETLCFLNENSKASFAKDAQINQTKAEAQYRRLMASSKASNALTETTAALDRAKADIAGAERSLHAKQKLADELGEDEFSDEEEAY